MAARSSSRFCFFSFALLDFLCNKEKQAVADQRLDFEEVQGKRPNSAGPATSLQGALLFKELD